jgi:hypothetical protein
MVVIERHGLLPFGSMLTRVSYVQDTQLVAVWVVFR